MSLAVFFWVIYSIAFVLSIFGAAPNYRAWATGNLIYFLLIGILGVGVFGAAVHR